MSRIQFLYLLRYAVFITMCPVLASISVRNVRNMQHSNHLNVKTDPTIDINHNASNNNLTYYHNMDNYIKSDHHRDVYFQQDERYDVPAPPSHGTSHLHQKLGKSKSSSQRDLHEQQEREHHDAQIRVSSFNPHYFTNASQNT